MLRTRTLGKSGLETSELALGTWALDARSYGPVASDEADRTIAKGYELGIRLFETADIYGLEGERVEARLGRVLEKEKDALFCTKGGNDLAASPPKKRFDRVFLQTSAARSAERLRRPPDLYLLHHPSLDALHRGEAVAALDELVTAGVIRQWGVACGDTDVARLAMGLGATVIELAYNLLLQQDLHDLASEIMDLKVGVLARSPLAYGLLCGTWSPEQTFAEGDHRRDRWTSEDLTKRLRQVAALRPLVKAEVHTLRAVALRFTLSNQLISSVVVGAKSAAQIEQNVRAIGDGPPYLSEDDLSSIPLLLRGAGAD
ncbi:MAG: aldo/keto reductase [Polyangiales bacterium]